MLRVIMSWYHVFLSYSKDNGEEQTLLQYNTTDAEIRSKIITPLNQGKAFFLIGYVIKPSAVHQLKIYKSDREYQNLVLPEGRSPLGRQHEYVRYYFDHNQVQGVEDCTAVFSPLSKKDTVEETEQFQDHIEEFIATDTSLRPPQEEKGDGLSSRYNLKIFGPCTFAYFGNLVFLVLQRWVDSQNPSLFAMAYRGDTILTFWSILSAAIGFTLVFGSTFFLSKKGWNSSHVAIINAMGLIALLIMNIPMNFNIETSQAEYPVIVYSTPILIMVGEVALISYTLFTKFDGLLIREKELLHQEMTRVLGSLLTMPFVIMIIGILVTFLSRTSLEWKMVFPVWFGYLILGAVLWVLAIHFKIRELQLQLGDQLDLISFENAFPTLPPARS
jgi:hypothetical protein